MFERPFSMSLHLRGIFLTSDRPDRTAAFYKDVTGLALQRVGDEQAGYWKIDEGGAQLAIHDAGKFSDYTHPADPASNLTHLYFKISDRAMFSRKLRAAGIEPFREDDIVITVLDPDGRKVMFGTA